MCFFLTCICHCIVSSIGPLLSQKNSEILAMCITWCLTYFHLRTFLLIKLQKIIQNVKFMQFFLLNRPTPPRAISDIQYIHFHDFIINFSIRKQIRLWFYITMWIYKTDFFLIFPFNLKICILNRAKQIEFTEGDTSIRKT